VIKSQNRKEQVNLAAAKLFRHRGYNATSMRDIAAEVGIKGSSLYNHIKSKQDILAGLLLSIADEFTTNMNEIEASPLKSYDKLERLIRHQVQLSTKETDALALVPNEWVHLEGPHKSKFVKLKDRYESKFLGILNACKKEGSISDVNTDIAMFSILSTLRWSYSWYSKNKNINTIELEEQMIHCLLDGIKA